jgi:mRNA interferase RelE/StbE
MTILPLNDVKTRFSAIADEVAATHDRVIVTRNGKPHVMVISVGIPLNAAWAIFEFIHGPLSQDPWKVFKPLHDELEGFRGARRGEYRVVLRIDEEQRTVRVVRVDHRPDIYRPA